MPPDNPKTRDKKAVKPPESAPAPVEQPEAIEGQIVGDGPETALVAPQTEPYRVLDRADEDQILDELQGKLLGTMVYDFEQGGSKIADLSYAGVLECIRQLNAAGYSIHVQGDPPPTLDEIVEEDDTYYRVLVYAKDDRTGMGNWGLAKQPKHKRRKGGKKERDFFAETIALNKAQRNALRTFIPEQWRQTLIAQYLGDSSKVKRIRTEAGAEKLVDLPPPLTGERADAQRKRARAVYDELKEHDRTAIPPGAFGAHLTRVEHDHDRLDDFIHYLEDKLGESKRESA